MVREDKVARQQIAAGWLGVDAASADMEAQARGNIVAAQDAYLNASNPEQRTQAAPAPI